MLNPLRLASRAAGACALALAVLFPAHASPVLQMSTAASASGVDLTVSAKDVVDLYGYQFTLNFDRSLLSALSVTEGSLLANAGATFFYPGEIDNLAGSISFVLGTLIGPGDGVDGSGDLATFSFSIAQRGLASFTLSDVLLLDSTGAAIPAGVTDLVAAVPEPASLLLVGSALFVVVGGRTFKRRTA